MNHRFSTLSFPRRHVVIPAQVGIHGSEEPSDTGRLDPCPRPDRGQALRGGDILNMLRFYLLGPFELVRESATTDKISYF